MYTTITERTDTTHEHAKALVRALSGALSTWQLDLVVGGHLWTCDGWTVRADAGHPHVVVTGPAPHGGRQVHHATNPDPTQLLANMTVWEAPDVSAADDALVATMTANWPVSS